MPAAGAEHSRSLHISYTYTQWARQEKELISCLRYYTRFVVVVNSLETLLQSITARSNGILSFGNCPR